MSNLVIFYGFKLATQLQHILFSKRMFVKCDGQENLQMNNFSIVRTNIQMKPSLRKDRDNEETTKTT